MKRLDNNGTLLKHRILLNYSMVLPPNVRVRDYSRILLFKTRLIVANSNASCQYYILFSYCVPFAYYKTLTIKMDAHLIQIFFTQLNSYVLAVIDYDQDNDYDNDNTNL